MHENLGILVANRKWVIKVLEMYIRQKLLVPLILTVPVLFCPPFREKGFFFNRIGVLFVCCCYVVVHVKVIIFVTRFTGSIMMEDERE